LWKTVSCSYFAAAKKAASKPANCRTRQKNQNATPSKYSQGASEQHGHFSLIRSVRLSLIGQTPPNQSGANNFQNSFDQGNYQIQAISIAVNPSLASISNGGSGGLVNIGSQINTLAKRRRPHSKSDQRQQRHHAA
jgi:hypothetical protein